MSAHITTAATPSPAAPIRGWRRLFGDWLVVGSATAVCHFLGALTSLLLRMLLSPAQMGIFSALKLFISYGNYANLGISKGAAREFNVALGHGNTREARHGLNLAFTVNTITSLLYAALLVGVAVWIAATGGGIWTGAWALGLATVGTMAVLTRYVTFHITILRTSQAFAVTSRLSILEAVLTLLICGIATWCWGLPGLLGGTVAVTLASLVYVRRHAAASLRWAWDAPEIRRLVAIGGPILLAGAASTLFRSLDKLMILAFMRDCEFQLGCYSVALLVTGQLFGLGNMLSMVAAPRYAEKYGRSGNRKAVARLAARSSELVAAAVALPAALALVVAPPLLAWLLPDYGPGLPPMVWLVPGVLAMILTLPASQYLVATGRQHRAMVAVIAATAVAAAGNFIAIRAGYGLIGVAAATAIGYTAYFLLVAAISFGVELDALGQLRYAAMLALLLGPTLAAALLLRNSWPNAVAVVCVWALCTAIAWHRGHWRNQLRT